MHYVFAVRHNGTGAYLPQSFKGASWWDGAKISEKDIPRLFYSQRAAQSFVSQWARGRVTKRTASQPIGLPYEEVYEFLEHEDVGRKASDLRIVAMKLEEC